MDATIDVTINVTNMDIPAVPEQPTVNPTPGADAGLTVTWTDIAATDASPVDGYDVQYREKNAEPANTWTEVSVTTKLSVWASDRFRPPSAPERSPPPANH